MTETVKEPFCPLYREVLDNEPWKKSSSAHRGLLFDKYADAWRRDQKTTYAFDKGDSDESAGKWLRKMAAECGDRDRLTEACMRQRQLVDSIGGRMLYLKNTSRFVTGLGREHPLENGFAWHQTLGVPYLPGSSLKGMLRTWYRETHGDLGTDRRGNPKWEEAPETVTLFGHRSGVGHVILLDMIPVAPLRLAVDIMTPHYGPYYQDGAAPGDWHSPVPISFLTVEAGANWQVAILPGPKQRAVTDEQLNDLQSALFEAFEWLGAGAKTAVGHGRFEQDSEGEERRRKEEEQIRLAQEAEAQRKAEKAEFEKSLESASEELRQLKTLQREHQWKPEAGDHNMLQDLQTFADQHPDPPDDCLAFVQQWLESIPNYKGVWENPDAMKGKKKDKPKYSSRAIRELVHRFRSDRGS